MLPIKSFGSAGLRKESIETGSEAGERERERGIGLGNDLETGFELGTP